MSKKKGFGFLLGAGIGAGITALLTTKKGKEYKDKLCKTCNDTVEKVKKLEPDDVKEFIEEKIAEIKIGLEDLDKEKVKKVAAKKAKELQDMALEVANYAVEKGTPVLKDMTENIKKETIKVTKEILKKLEKEEQKNK